MNLDKCSASPINTVSGSTAGSLFILSPHELLKKNVHKTNYIMKAVEGGETSEPSYTVGGNVRWYNHYGKQ